MKKILIILFLFFLISEGIFAQLRVLILPEKDIFYSGEFTNVKALLYEESTMSLENSYSGFISISINDANHQIISRYLLEIKSGKGEGIMSLPKEIPTGNYYLKGYLGTNGKLAFSSTITLINLEKATQQTVKSENKNYLQLNNGQLNLSGLVDFNNDNNYTARINGKMINRIFTLENPLLNIPEEYTRQGINQLELISENKSANYEFIYRQGPVPIQSNSSSLIAKDPYTHQDEPLLISATKSLNEENSGNQKILGKGLFIKGKVVDPNGSTIVTMVFTGIAPFIQYVYTNETGEFLLENINIEGIYDIQMLTDNDKTIVIESSNLIIPEAVKDVRPLSLPEKITSLDSIYKELLIKKGHDENNLKKEQTLLSIVENIDPLVSARPEDYQELRTTEETMREILPFKKLRNKKGVYELRLLNSINNTFYSASPTIFLDGVLVGSISDILAIPIEKIEEFAIYSGTEVLSVAGRLGVNGILSVTTKQGEGYTVMSKNLWRGVRGFMQIPSFNETQRENIEPEIQLLKGNYSMEIRSIENTLYFHELKSKL